MTSLSNYKSSEIAQITQTTLTSAKEEVKTKKDFTLVAKVLSILSKASEAYLEKGKFIYPQFIPLFKKGLKKGLLQKELVSKTINNFRLAISLSSTLVKESIEIETSDGKSVFFNDFLLSWSTSFFSDLLTTNFRKQSKNADGMYKIPSRFEKETLDLVKDFIYTNQEPTQNLSFFSLYNLYQASTEYGLQSLRKKCLIEIRNAGFTVHNFDQDWPEVLEKLSGPLYSYHEEFHSSEKNQHETLVARNIEQIEFRIIASRLREKCGHIGEDRELCTLSLHLEDLLQLKGSLESLCIKKFLRYVDISKNPHKNVPFCETLDVLSLMDYSLISGESNLALIINETLTQTHIDFLSLAFPDTRYIRIRSSLVDFKDPLKAFAKFQKLERITLFSSLRQEILVPMTREFLLSLKKISFDKRSSIQITLAAVMEDTDSASKTIEYIQSIMLCLQDYFEVNHIKSQQDEKMHYFKCTSLTNE